MQNEIPGGITAKDTPGRESPDQWTKVSSSRNKSQSATIDNSERNTNSASVNQGADGKKRIFKKKPNEEYLENQNRTSESAGKRFSSYNKNRNPGSQSSTHFYKQQPPQSNEATKELSPLNQNTDIKDTNQQQSENRRFNSEGFNRPNKPRQEGYGQNYSGRRRADVVGKNQGGGFNQRTSPNRRTKREDRRKVYSPNRRIEIDFDTLISIHRNKKREKELKQEKEANKNLEKPIQESQKEKNLKDDQEFCEVSVNQIDAQVRKAEKRKRQRQKKKEKEKINSHLKERHQDEEEEEEVGKATKSEELKNKSNLGIIHSITHPGSTSAGESNETSTTPISSPLVDPPPDHIPNLKTDLDPVVDIVPGTKSSVEEKVLESNNSSIHPTTQVESSIIIESLSKPSSKAMETVTRDEVDDARALKGEKMFDLNLEQNRDNIKAVREAKKLAKQAAKKNEHSVSQKLTTSEQQEKMSVDKLENEKFKDEKQKVEASEVAGSNEKNREQIKAEREAKKLAKQAAKKKLDGDVKGADDTKPSGTVEKLKEEAPLGSVDKKAGKTVTEKNLTSSESIESETTKVEELCKKLDSVHITGNTDAKKATTKAERRAIQEAQREAKAKTLADKQPKQPQQQQKQQQQQSQPKEQTQQPAKRQSKGGARKRTPSRKRDRSRSAEEKPHIGDYRVKLFSHLHDKGTQKNEFINHSVFHPAIVRLGEQYAQRTIVGSNARCIAFLYGLKSVIRDYETPPKKDFRRSLELTLGQCVAYLQTCRPLAVSISNAYKYIKYVFTQLDTEQPESDLKKELCESIDTYVRDQIEKAAEAISNSVQEKISNGDVILTFGCSSLINRIFTEAHRRGVDFRVILVDSRPFLEGHELLRRLVSKGIKCTCVLINAVAFIMPEATKVLLGAHALLANGYVMARTGTAQVALVARSYNVPVLVCCETHKFSERVQTDAIVYNELGNPDDLVQTGDTKDKSLENWRSFKKFSPVNLNYDVTPPELVTAVVTEVAILPCTSVPVILRIKPSESG